MTKRKWKPTEESRSRSGKAILARLRDPELVESVATQCRWPGWHLERLIWRDAIAAYRLAVLGEEEKP